MPNTENTSPTTSHIPIPPPNDSRGFTLYTTIKDITLIPPNPRAPRDLQVDLFRLKCDNLEAHMRDIGDFQHIYAGAGSLHFYTAPEQDPEKAWRVGEMLEITVKPWDGTYPRGWALEAGKRFIGSIIEAEKAKQE